MWITDVLNKYVNKRPSIIVETGSFTGDGISNYLKDSSFKEIHSIELSEKWYTHCKNKFANESRVKMHHGDSSQVLATEFTALNYPEPLLFYLDAHYSGGETEGKDICNGCPLLNELETILKRKQSDIIIIDDMRLMGKKGFGGSLGDVVYPLTLFDFRHASIDNIFNVFHSHNVKFEASMLPNSDRMLIKISI